MAPKVALQAPRQNHDHAIQDPDLWGFPHPSLPAHGTGASGSYAPELVSEHWVRAQLELTAPLVACQPWICYVTAAHVFGTVRTVKAVVPG